MKAIINKKVLLTVVYPMVIWLMSILPLSLKAYDFEKDGLYYNFVSGTSDQIAVTYNDKYNTDYSGDIVIPQTVSRNNITYKVTIIGNSAFYWCEKLTSVVLPNTIQTIESWAFCGSSLPTVTVPESVTKIGDYAFINSKLTTINVAENNTVYASIDGVLYNKDKTTLLFYPCGRTKTDFTVPDSVTSIGEYAFASCSNLTSINIPNSVNSIGEYAFESCSNLVSINLPNSITTIGWGTFSYCTGLTSITLSESLTTIGCFAFESCNRLNSITIPQMVTTIDYCAFYECSSLKSIVLSESLTYIGVQAFYNCINLTSITLPESLTYIGHSAFFGCKLSSVKIPRSLTSIDGISFWGDFFTTVEVDDNNPNFSAADGILYNKDKTTLVLYPSGKKDSAFVVPRSVTTIGAYAFCDHSNLTSITLPKSLTEIGERAFNSCYNLKEITFPESLKTIGYAAFEMCGFSTITIPASVETIGSWAFTKCPNLKTIIFEGPVKSMGSVIFVDWGFVPRKYDLVVKCPPFTVPAYFSSDFDLDKSTLTVPAGTKSLFESTPVWQDFKNIIESSPTGIPNIQSEPKVFVSGNTLYLDTPVSETVSVYSLTGNLLYSGVKSAGEVQIALGNIPGNFGIVKGSSGWVKKVRF